MKRRPIIAGNWKMHKTVREAVELAQALITAIEDVQGVDRVLCPSFTALAAVGEVLRGTSLQLGAQDMHWEKEGAFTGEVSPLQLAELCHYVIVGHSERRRHFGETDETVNRKLRAAHGHGLVPIVCVGERDEERQRSRTEEVVGRQTRAAFSGLSPDEAAATIVAYEPLWAIGTGRAATPQDAAETIEGVVRRALEELYGSSIAQRVRVQYGGSVIPDNIESFMARPEIDGALVGGASLRAESFARLVEGAARAS